MCCYNSLAKDSLSHYEGFEQEEHYHLILNQALCDCPVIKSRTVRRIITHVKPDFIEGLFERRTCKRLLRYIGDPCSEIEEDSDDKFFKINEIYESMTFNGATYTIKGYKNGTKVIGSVYFERVS